MPDHFLFSYSQKKEEVLSVTDKLNPIKIWWGVGAWLGTQLGLPACQAGPEPASQPDKQPGSQASRQTPTQSRSSRSNSQPVRKVTSCLYCQQKKINLVSQVLCQVVITQIHKTCLRLWLICGVLAWNRARHHGRLRTVNVLY